MSEEKKQRLKEDQKKLSRGTKNSFLIVIVILIVIKIK